MRSTKWSRNAAGRRDRVSICGITHQKSETSHLIPQLLYFFGVGGGSKALRQS